MAYMLLNSVIADVMGENDAMFADKIARRSAALERLRGRGPYEKPMRLVRRPVRAPVPIVVDILTIRRNA